MALQVSYQSQQCNSCGGRRLEYNAQSKVWVCQYCGNRIERVEQTDSVYGIKNVVRQVLQDVAYRRMASALGNIAESEKIDARYVGTLEAALAYEVAAVKSGGLSQNEQRNVVNQMKKKREQLLELGDAPTEEEKALFDALESDEATAVLATTFDFVGLTTRRDYLLSRLDASQIYSLELNTELLTYALKNEDWSLFDSVSRNSDNIRSKDVVNVVLTRYPDGEQKRENIHRLIAAGDWSQDEREMFTDYFNETEDAADTLLTVAIAVSNLPCRPNIECLVKRMVTRLTTEEQVCSFLTALTAEPLLDVEIYTILTYALGECRDAVCLRILQQFYETNQYVELDHTHLLSILRRDSDVGMRVSIFEAALKFRLKNNALDRTVSAYLCEGEDEASARKELLTYLLGLVKALSTATVEAYLLDSSKDEQYKEDIAAQIFAMEINRAFFRETIQKYMCYSSDETAKKLRLVRVMIEAGLPVSPTGCVYILNSAMPSEDKIALLRHMREGGLRYDDVVNEYAAACHTAQCDQAVFAELVLGSVQISEATVITYVLSIPAHPQTKASLVRTMLQKCYNPPAQIGCRIHHLGHTLVCNIVQAYLLISPEATAEAAVVLDTLVNGAEWTGDVTVDDHRTKFKRYIGSQKKELSAFTAEMCSRYRLL